MPHCAMPEVTSPSRWEAEIRLGFTRNGEVTRLTKRVHRGPLRVQKALYPEGGAVCQAILLHPPSGIAGGDRLNITANIGPQAHAQITTPGAGKWYRSAGAEATQTINFQVGDNGILEWLPQETIVFDGAISRMENHVQLGTGSRYFGWDILCLGRSASGERFTHGHLALLTRITRQIGDDSRPLWLERGHIAGDDPLLASLAGWAGASVSGTLLANLPAGIEIVPLLEACRAVEPADQAEHAVTVLPGLLLARYLGHNSEAARLWFARLWEVLRPPLLGKPALMPRIWKT